MTPSAQRSGEPVAVTIQQLASVLDLLPTPAFATDSKGAVLLNSRFADLAGTSAPVHWVYGVHPDDIPVLESCLCAERPFRVDVRLGRQETGYHWFSCTGAPLPKFANNAMIATFADVHELKSSNRDEQANARLVQQIVEKDEAIARNTRELQQFAYVTSHDLQEPLRMVSSYASLLARKYQGKLDAQADEYIGYTIEGVNRMADLIKDLISYSRATTPGDRPFQEVRLAGVAEWAKMNLQEAIEASQARIEYDSLPVVLGDEIRLAQVFQHLLSNSIKFRSERPLVIRIAAARDGDRWVVSVEDNGIGFDVKYADRILGVFKRLHGREYPGNGIGLAIADRIVRQHGGQIWAESEPEKGSKFSFSLQAAD